MLIDVNTIWLICLAVAAPIAGFVGFAIQLRTVKKVRLENEKLTLEILTLLKKQEESERRIVTPSNEEVIKYNDVMFSSRGPDTKPDDYDHRSNNSPIVDFAIKTVFMILFVTIIFYLIFDIYRLGKWLYSLA